jgi:hypothetical protein
MIQDAFREIMTDIERRIEARVRKGGAQENRLTGNLVYAFPHSSLENQPPAAVYKRNLQNSDKR